MSRRPQGKKPKNRFVKFMKRNGLLILFVAVFAFSAAQLIRILGDYKRGQDIYSSIRESFTAPVRTTEKTEPETKSETATQTEAPTQSETTTQQETPSVQEPLPVLFPENEHEKKLNFLHTTFDYILVPEYAFDLSALQAVNPDVCGWIQIEGTHVDYPVVQGTDNEFYLRATVTREPNNAGSIFVDYRIASPFESPNTIIHGHNQKNSQMFHDLVLFEDRDFLKEHPYVKIYTTKGDILIYRIFSCYYMTNTYTYKTSFATEDSYVRYLEYAAAESAYDTGIVPDPGRNIITLSTCTNQSDERRYVVHAVLVTGQ